MRYWVALDDGHGMNTPGKRTPKFADGTFMHENDFNRAVVAMCKEHLELCGIGVLLTAPSDDDLPLQQRVAAANENNVSIFVSVHANALNDYWGNPKGIEALYYPGSSKGKKLAETLLKHLLNGTPLVDRGAKERGDLYVLKATKMPSALVECGFMDNPDEARLLMSDSYREECAEELARGICEFLEVEYIERSDMAEKREPVIYECHIELDGKILDVKGFIRNGRSLVPCKTIGAMTGYPAGWDQTSKKAIMNDRLLETTVIIGDQGFAHSIEIAEAIQYQVVWENQSSTVKFFKESNEHKE